MCVSVRVAEPLEAQWAQPRPYGVQRSQRLALPHRLGLSRLVRGLESVLLEAKATVTAHPGEGIPLSAPETVKGGKGPPLLETLQTPKARAWVSAETRGGWVCGLRRLYGQETLWHPAGRGEWPVLSDSQGSAGTQVSAGGHGALLS